MKKKPRCFVLGLDPGTNRTGYAIVEWTRPKILIMQAGHVRLVGDLPGRLRDLQWTLPKVLMKFPIYEAAVEGGFVGFGEKRNPPAQLALAEARGVCKAVAMQFARRCAQYSPIQVKKALTGNHKAEKSDMIRFVELRFNFIADEDTADAIGVAVCHAERVGADYGQR